MRCGAKETARRRHQPRCLSIASKYIKTLMLGVPGKLCVGGYSLNEGPIPWNPIPGKLFASLSITVPR